MADHAFLCAAYGEGEDIIEVAVFPPRKKRGGKTVSTPLVFQLMAAPEHADKFFFELDFPGRKIG